MLLEMNILASRPTMSIHITMVVHPQSCATTSLPRIKLKKHLHTFDPWSLMLLENLGFRLGLPSSCLRTFQKITCLTWSLYEMLNTVQWRSFVLPKHLMKYCSLRRINLIKNLNLKKPREIKHLTFKLVNFVLSF